MSRAAWEVRLLDGRVFYGQTRAIALENARNTLKVKRLPVGTVAVRMDAAAAWQAAQDRRFPPGSLYRVVPVESALWTPEALDLLYSGEREGAKAAMAREVHYHVVNADTGALRVACETEEEALSRAEEFGGLVPEFAEAGS